MFLSEAVELKVVVHRNANDAVAKAAASSGTANAVVLHPSSVLLDLRVVLLAHDIILSGVTGGFRC